MLDASAITKRSFERAGPARKPFLDGRNRIIVLELRVHGRMSLPCDAVFLARRYLLWGTAHLQFASPCTSNLCPLPGPSMGGIQHGRTRHVGV